MSGITQLATQFKINGVLSTDATVMQNIETLCSAAQAWLTYDINAGRWAVNINQAGFSVASFDNSNIIGPISVSGTGLRDLYNSVRVEFPHIDLRDNLDFVTVEIPDEDRNANEPDNQLNIVFDVLNDPTQAELLGVIELKQSRVDKVIQFVTDYSYLGLTAGSLIDVTNDVLGYTNKIFRIISIAEEDSDDGNIALNITALEYDANVYDPGDLFRFTRTDENGLITIGQIGIPGTPTITATSQDVRPRVSIESTVPEGIVNGMEFWLSEDDGTTFVLLATERASGGGNFTFGDTIGYEYDKVVTGNLQAKTRAVNSTTSSLYSNVGSLNNFVPVQVTDAIGFDTEVLDEFGEFEPLQLALPLLMTALDGFLDGDSDMDNVFGNLFDSLFGPAFDSASAALGGGLNLAFQKVLVDGSAPVQDAYTVLTTTAPMSFTVTEPGNYLVSIFANFGASGTPGPTQDAAIELKLFTGGTPGSGTFVSGSFTGTSYSGVNVYDDLDAHVTVYLTAGTYNIEVTYYTTEATFLAVQTVVNGPATYGAIEGTHIEPA
jgi:hypothetical protein